MTYTRAQVILAIQQTRALCAGEGGWCQGISQDCDSGCIVWHLSALCGSHTALFHAVLDWIGQAIGTASVVDWNDAPGRTQAEVVAALDRAQRRALTP